MRRLLLAASILALAACGEAADPTATASTDPVSPAPASQSASQGASQAASAPLSQRLDCLREAGGAVVIGHRGGPTRDYPENAIETLERTLRAGVRAMEIDIAQTSDGHLVLMHDDDLERTTTGSGLVADRTLADLQALRLETYSTLTDYRIPTLADALEWAVRNNALLELDKKRSTEYAPVIAAVRAAGAENNVIVITYTDAQAAEVHRLAPELVITATITNAAQLDRLIASGVKPEHLLAWTGTAEPDPALWRTLQARGVESIFGTVGRRGERFDDIYWEDDDGSEYGDLIAGGASLVVTGLSDKVARQLAPEIAKARACGL